MGYGKGLEYFVFKCWNDMHGMHHSRCGILLYMCMYVFIMLLISGQVQDLDVCTYHKWHIVYVLMYSYICKKLYYAI